MGNKGKIAKTIEIVKQKIRIIANAYSHPDLPLKCKILIFLTVGYALSPIDLIPDFIPFIGYLDDLIILPFLIYLCYKSIPVQILKDAEQQTYEGKKPSGYLAAIIALLIWLTIIGVIIIVVIKFFISKTNS